MTQPFPSPSLSRARARLLAAMAKHQIQAISAAGAAAAVVVVVAALLLCALPRMCAARDLKRGFVVQGRVFCDTCRAGFETPATTYVAGAKVRVECRAKTTDAKICSFFDGVADHTGTYNIYVDDEHGHEICEAVLVSSPDRGCSSAVEGRDRARVSLTHNNGIASDFRFVNALGFQKDTPLAGCSQLLKMYEPNEE